MFRFPFDWENPYGYSVAITIQIIIANLGILIGACALVMGIGFYSFAIATGKSVKGSLFFIQRNITAETNQNNLLEQLIEFLEFHARVKR